MTTRIHRGATIGVALLALVALGSGLARAQRPAAPVRFTAAVDRPVRGSLVLPGSVASRRAAVVAAEVEGYVIAVDVDPGDRIREGHPLARLRTTSTDLQLRAARGRLKEAEARLEMATSNLQRAERLFEDEIVSQEERDDASSEFTAWQGRVDQTQAEIAQLEVNLERCVVRAPFDGVVVEKRTEVGQWINKGGDVVELVALNQIEVRVDVPDRHYALLRDGSTAEIRFDSIPGLIAQGEVHGVIPSADPQARTFPTKIWIFDPDPRIAVGMLAQVALPVGETYQATVVPKDAVVRQGGGELLYRIKNDDTVEPVPVRSGQAIGVWIVVEGISAGERVVTRGNERLRPGQSVAAELLEYALP